VERRGRGEGVSLPGDELRGASRTALAAAVSYAQRQASSLTSAVTDGSDINTDERSVDDIAAQIRALASTRLDDEIRAQPNSR
jgi:hypothetical protein